MPFPRAVARFNRRYTNRFIEPLVRTRAGFAVVHHTGRRSGADYTAPVKAFPAGRHLVVALTYGPGADWFRNVEAGPGAVEIDGELRPIVAVELVGRSAAWPALPRFIRLALRALRVTDFARLTLAEGTPR